MFEFDFNRSAAWTFDSFHFDVFIRIILLSIIRKPGAEGTEGTEGTP